MVSHGLEEGDVAGDLYHDMIRGLGAFAKGCIKRHCKMYDMYILFGSCAVWVTAPGAARDNHAGPSLWHMPLGFHTFLSGLLRCRAISGTSTT